jgi:DNA ligase D-like protein (predicted 3'-phosphoesterase)
VGRDPLETYHAKRDFRRTTEPRGVRPRGRRRASRFVIQEHAARSHHYDLRLEAGGVLRSWAVPKGPSTDPREKRFATATEDHPLDYLNFEGTIPEGSYGAGSVIVWDTGTYRNLTRDRDREVPVDEGIENGHVSVWLDGEKLRGGYALTRFRGHDQWLLVKMKDDEADARRNVVRSQPESVVTGCTIDEVAEQEDEA